MDNAQNGQYWPCGEILGGADDYRAKQEISICIYKRQGEEIMQMEKSESGSSSHSIFCHECIPLAYFYLHRVGANDEFFLVGQESEREERYLLDFLGRLCSSKNEGQNKPREC